MKAEEIFLAAVEKNSPGERAAYLDGACGKDAALRGQVEALLKAHDGAGSFLEQPLLEPTAAATEQPALVEKLGAVIGPYKLLEQIGEGGFGVVFMAEQTQPVRRKVALKVVKPGMDTRQVVVRFEAERQALALMDHPNIAHVLDGGETASGRPYFVMELVRGIPITEFCDKSHLSVHARLELFVSVCQAVQHAHQKGIIHRDLKPSNVMVTLHDDKPVVKVIDFGIAKATGQQLTDKTLFTHFAQMIGTPMYMSPEQAQMSGLDIDTRSDIYSLGVLLYELLTGTTPFDREQLLEANYDEVRRIIREVDPPRPSTRISTLGQAATTLSTNRGTDPKRLSRLLRRELDWIVMKALEKDRNRRYEAASDFAADVQRFLHDEPVLACPPSAWYRIRKLARRNKGRLAIAAGVFLVATALAATIGWGVRDRAAHNAEMELAEAGRLANVEVQVRESLRTARAAFAENRLDQAQQHVGAARVRLGSDSAILEDLAAEITATEVELNRFLKFSQLMHRAAEVEAEPILEAALAYADPSDSKKARKNRRWTRAAPLLLEALKCYEILERDDWPVALDTDLLGRDQIERVRRNAYIILVGLAKDVLKRRSHHGSGAELSPQAAGRQALAYLEKAAIAHEPSLVFYVVRARCQMTLGDEAAAQADQQLADRMRPTLALDHFERGEAAYDAKQMTIAVQAFEAALRMEPTYYEAMLHLGYCLCDLGQKDDDVAAAVVAFTGCVMMRPKYAHAYFCRAAAYTKLRRHADALADLSRSIKLRPEASAWTSRGNTHRRLDRPAEAIKDYTAAIALDPNYAKAWYNRGRVRLSLGQTDEALADHTRAVELAPDDANAWNHRGVVHVALRELEKALEDYDQAIKLDPELAPAWYNRGRVYADLNQLEKARAQFSQAIKLDPKNANAFNNRGNVLRLLGERDQALADYNRALELDSTIAQGWSNRGDLLLDMLRPDKALPDLDQAIKLDPKLARAWANRGSAYRLLNQPEKALANCDEAIKLDSKSAHAWNSRGAVYRRLSQLDKAMSDFTRAIEVDPKYASALSNRGALFIKLREPKKALADLDVAVTQDPKSAGAWSNRGIAHRLLGEPDKALADYDQAIELDKQFASAWHNRGLLHYHQGRFGKAEADLSQAIELKWPTSREWLAWLLAMCPDPAYRDARRAVELAKQAVAANPKDGKCLHTLACAHYRAGDYKLTVAAIDKIKTLAKPGDGWFVLAMAQWQLGNKDEARQCYDQAVKYMDSYHSNDMEIRRCRAEAAELLGVK